MTSDALASRSADLAGRVALITGGAQGLGAGLASRLRNRGVDVMVADIDLARGEALAAELGACFVRCDVSDYQSNLDAVRATVAQFGGLDLAFLNAGISAPMQLGGDFDPARYRHVMGVNLDGVVYGLNAVLPALRARGGGQVVATSSMAGLTAVPLDPIYAANKSAVVGLVRSAALAHGSDNIRINAICPAFADTALLGPFKKGLTDAGVPILTVEAVIDVFMQILDSDELGQCWYVQPGRPSEPFAFRRAPGPRTAEGLIAPAADPETQRKIRVEPAATA